MRWISPQAAKTKPKQIRYNPSYKQLVSVKVQKHEHPSHLFIFYKEMA